MLDLVTALINEGIDARLILDRDSVMLTALQSNETAAYHHRFLPASRHGADLMREKLLAEVMPYAVQVGKAGRRFVSQSRELTGQQG